MVFNSSRNGVNQYENLEIFYYCKSYYFSDKKYIFEEFCYTHKKKKKNLSASLRTKTQYTETSIASNMEESI